MNTQEHSSPFTELLLKFYILSGIIPVHFRCYYSQKYWELGIPTRRFPLQISSSFSSTSQIFSSKWLYYATSTSSLHSITLRVQCPVQWRKLLSRSPSATMSWIPLILFIPSREKGPRISKCAIVFPFKHELSFNVGAYADTVNTTNICFPIVGIYLTLSVSIFNTDKALHVPFIRCFIIPRKQCMQTNQHFLIFSQKAVVRHSPIFLILFPMGVRIPNVKLLVIQTISFLLIVSE